MPAFGHKLPSKWRSSKKYKVCLESKIFTPVLSGIFVIYLFICLFLFFLVWPILHTHYRSRGLLPYLLSLNDTHTHTLGRTLLGEESARRWNFYLTTHNTHNKQTSIPPAGFKPTIPAIELPRTHALDGAATEIGGFLISFVRTATPITWRQVLPAEFELL